MMSFITTPNQILDVRKSVSIEPSRLKWTLEVKNDCGEWFDLLQDPPQWLIDLLLTVL